MQPAIQSSATVSVFRATINRQNAQHSTGPRTEAGKRRSSLNALQHGLTATSAVLPSEDPAAYQQHCLNFRNEYQPATPTETHWVQELADTAWRLNRIPLLEAQLLASVPNSESLIPALSRLGLHAARLSRQFQNTLRQLRDLQSGRRQQERRDLRDAADLLELHKHKGIPWQPSDHGFVFSKERVEQHAERLMRQNEACHIGAVRFRISPLHARDYLASHGL
ncbi:MAG TPA: hypothetical protein VKT81_11605 [Bryobacteraceae bacterium]|nr:hypothetical protein [Bryobacteraceae bacterium]